MWYMSEMQKYLVQFYGFFVSLLTGAGPYGEPLVVIYRVLAWLIVFLPAILLIWTVRDMIRSIRAQEAAPIYWAKRIMWFPVLAILVVPVPGRLVADWINSDPYLILNGKARFDMIYNARLPLLNWIIYGLARGGMVLAGKIATPWQTHIITKSAELCVLDDTQAWLTDFKKIIGDPKAHAAFSVVVPKQFQNYFVVYQQDRSDFCKLTAERGILTEVYLSGSDTLRSLGVTAFQSAYIHRLRMQEDITDAYSALIASLLMSINDDLDPANCFLQKMLPVQCLYTKYQQQLLRQAQTTRAPYVIISRAQKLGWWGRIRNYVASSVVGVFNRAKLEAEKAKKILWDDLSAPFRGAIALGRHLGARKGGLKMDTLFVYAISVAFTGFMLYYFVMCLLTLARTYFYILFRVPFSESHGDEFLRIGKQLVALFFVPSFALLGFFLATALRMIIVETIMPLIGTIVSAETFLSFFASAVGKFILSVTTVLIFSALIFMVGLVPIKIATRVDEGVVGQEGPQIKPSVPMIEKYGVQ